ncbi:hypothetical protein KAR91_72670 [Candidatus Pacearchaeota archaeon]|nr:hypothetical protein [Candidatus Pacearchaeota archaeon]
MSATINLKVKSDFAAASADLKKFGTIAESERKRIEKFVDSFKSEQIDKFTDKARRNAAAIKATRGPVDALTAEYKQYQRQIETLIRRGLDPESKEIKTLTKRYKQLEKEIEDVGKAQSANQKRIKVTQGLMIGLGASAVLMGKQAVSAFIDFSKEAAQAASDAEEVEGKFNVVFRSVIEEADKMSASLADDFDLASSTAQQLLSDTGDLLTGFGLTGKAALDLSEETNRLAIDLASFTNAQGGAAAVSAALTKSYAGERESLKTYGIVISEADVKARLLEDAQKGLTFENEKAAKAYATLSLATEQSKNAIGDYARTSESAANVSRRFEESQKTLKEAFGVTINEGLTPLRSMFADINNSLAEWINKNREINNFLSEFKGGSIDAAVGIDTLGESLKLSQDRLDQAIASGRGHTENLEREVAELKILIAQRARGAALDLQFADARAASDEKAAEAAKKALDAVKGEQDALIALEKLRVASLSTEEKRLEQIQGEIDHLVILKQAAKDTGEEWDAIERLLVITLEEKNELLNKTTEDVDKQRTQVIAAGEDWLSIEQAKIKHLIWIDGLEQEIQKHRDKEDDKQTVAAEKREAEFISMGNTISGFAAGPLTELGAALADGEAGWSNFAKAGIGAIAEVVRALGKMAIVESAIRFARLDIAGGLAFAAAGAASFVAAGAIDAKAASFAEGGSFVTNGPIPLTVGDNIGGQERVTVEPISSTGLNADESPEGNGDSQTIIAQFGSRSLIGVIQDIFDSREVRVPKEIIV